MSLLSVRNLEVTFTKGKQQNRAIRGINLDVAEGQFQAIVGESGCGKTTLARCILGLQPFSGSIELDGRSVSGVHPGQASTVGVVWQDPFASLDPRWRIGDLITEPANLAKVEVNLDELLSQVGLNPNLKDRYPHQLSGGQRQRVAIARAIALRPKLLICDEPTSALDLSVQAQILNLLKDLQSELKCAFLYISHNLETVRFLSDHVAVMYLGNIVEFGDTDTVFESPNHPYTKLLLESALTPEHIGMLPEIETLHPSRGQAGCPFAPRCPRYLDRCSNEVPLLAGDAHQVACHNPLVAEGVR